MPAVDDKSSKKAAQRVMRKSRHQQVDVVLYHSGAKPSVEYFGATASRQVADLLINPPDPTEALRKLMQEE